MISAAQVLTLISLFQFHNHPAHYEYAKDATLIAQGIAQAVNEEQDAAITDSYNHDAVLLVVYAIYESGLHKCIKGDGGKSIGTFQLQGEDNIACTPLLAARSWIRRAKNSEEECTTNSEETQLAGLASGSCHRGLEIVSHRYKIYHELIELYNEYGFAQSIE